MGRPDTASSGRPRRRTQQEGGGRPGPDEELGSLREPTDLRSLARFVDTPVPVVEKVVEGRRPSPVPPGDEQTVKEMVDAQ